MWLLFSIEAAKQEALKQREAGSAGRQPCEALAQFGRRAAPERL